MGVKTARLVAVVVAGMFLSCTVGVSAQEYPTRAINLILPVAAGDAADLVGRLMGEELAKLLKVPIVPMNRPGAGTTLGTDAPFDIEGGRFSVRESAKAVKDARLTEQDKQQILHGTFERLFRVKLPVKVELKVTEAPPDVRGNTAQGGSKIVELETGATLDVPMFVKQGDVVRINTETGEYVERV